MKLLKPVVLGLAGFGLLLAAGSEAPTLNSQDKSFVSDAAKAGMAEVDMGKMGLQKAAESSVKSFSQRIINDHTKANEELRKIATRKGLTLPGDHTMPSTMNLRSGESFDHAFAQHAVEDHEKAVTLFEQEVSSGSDADLKAFANRTLPTLRAHLKEAQALPQH